ncbi:hypothetical protein [Lacticaseibacillus sharpeae]|uniref:hypothetical protein n=1 Tax=Lacticaseibacillus sharpeae TaxID=1626 RepID=UPI0006D01691|nr:hypothetical protein [Lacticaseibacillus sharpeae]
MKHIIGGILAALSIMIVTAPSAVNASDSESNVVSISKSTSTDKNASSVLAAQAHLRMAISHTGTVFYEDINYTTSVKALNNGDPVPYLGGFYFEYEVDGRTITGKSYID